MVIICNNNSNNANNNNNIYIYCYLFISISYLHVDNVDVCTQQIHLDIKTCTQRIDTRCTCTWAFGCRLAACQGASARGVRE